MKVKQLKWKNINGEYVAETPVGLIFVINPEGNKWNLYCDNEREDYLFDSLEEAQDAS